MKQSSAVICNSSVIAFLRSASQLMCGRHAAQHSNLPAAMCVHEQVNEAAEIIYDLVDQNANLIFGAVVDPACDKEVSP